MEALMMYLLKMLICSGILFGYYRLALYNERFHQWNRFYLLAAMLLSVVVPFLSIPFFTEEHAGNVEVFIAAMPWNIPVSVVAKQPGLLWQDMLLQMLGVVSLLLFVRIIVNITKLFITYKTNEVISLNSKVKLILTQLKYAPFSFFNWLFWRQEIDPASDNGQRMLTHELTHIKEHHSADKLFTEVLMCVFWMNPFFWLMRWELATIHEFLADRRAIDQQDGAAFAAMILHSLKVQPSSTSGLVNPFFSSQIKRRLLMITSSKEPKYSYLRRLSGLMLMICSAIVLTLSIQKAKAQQKEIIKQNKTEHNPQKQEATIKSKSAKREQTGNKADIITLEADSIIWNEKTNEVTAITASGEKVNLTLEQKQLEHLSFKSRAVVVIDHNKGNKSPGSSNLTDLTQLAAGHVIYIYDGKVVDEKEIQKLNPNSVGKVEVFKGEAAIAKYGEEGKNGVVVITGKTGTETPITSAGNQLKSTNALKEVAVKEIEANLKQEATSDKIFTKVEQPAIFPGGEVAWKKYFERNFHYPEAAQKAGTEGVAHLQFIIDQTGNVSNVKVLSEPGNGIGAEAMRLIKQGPKWQPAKQNGREVVYQMDMNIPVNANQYY